MVKEQKHLGLILESSLSFEKHLNEKIIKAKKNVGILKHLSKFLPLKTLDQMYKPLGVTLHSMIEKVEIIQYQAAFAISGAWHSSIRSKLYEKLGWETLSDRRMCRRILQIRKIFNNKTPSYLKINYLPITEHCTVETFGKLFMK